MAKHALRTWLTQILKKRSTKLLAALPNVSKSGSSSKRAAVPTKADSIKESDGAVDTTIEHPTGEGASQEESLVLALDSSLAQQLQTAILEHRSMKALEKDADAQLNSLEDQAGIIALQIRSLQDVVQDMKSGPQSAEQTDEIDDLYEAIARLREDGDANWDRRQRFMRHMSELYQDFRREQCSLFDGLETILVEKGRIPQSMIESSPTAANTQGEYPLEASVITLSTPKPELQHLLRRSATSIAKTAAESDEEAKTRALLLTDFLTKRKTLAAHELRFDTRNTLFDALGEERQQQFEAGEAVETATEFDLFTYDETRHLTRALIVAEAEYGVAKAAAVAAGIPLKFSDIESGFVDDVDDGYRISMEQDMIEDCDRGRIQDWLIGLKEKECPTNYLSGCDREEYEWEVLGKDGKPYREVEMCDSVSLVAEGGARRRIDRWRAQFA